MQLARPLDAKGWRDAQDPRALLEYLRGLTGHRYQHYLQVNPARRRARQFAVSCCRRVEHLVRFPKLSLLLSQVEQYSVGRYPLHQLLLETELIRAEVGDAVAEPSFLWDWLAREAHRLAPEYTLLQPTSADRLAHAACLRAADRVTDVAIDCWNYAAEAAANAGADLANELHIQTHILRDLFQNPFIPSHIDSRWRTRLVMTLAEEAIRTGGTGETPYILADALEEAGCDCPETLDHLRGDIPHSPGCWVLVELLEHHETLVAE